MKRILFFAVWETRLCLCRSLWKKENAMETGGCLNIGGKKKEHWIKQHLGYYLVGLFGF